MRSRCALFFFAATLAATASHANEYINGWTAETSDALKRGCMETGMNTQLRLLYNSGQLNQSSTPQEIASAKAIVAKALTSVCACSQKRFMSDYKFENAAQIEENPAYVKQVFTECAQKLQKSQGS